MAGFKVGDKVVWEGTVGTITRIDRPRCKCKGKGNYFIEVDDVINKVPLSTKLEKYESIGIIGTNITTHKL